MRVLLFTDTRSCIEGFDALGRSKNHSVEVYPTGDLKPVLEEVTHDTFIYLDITGLSIASIRPRLKLLEDSVSSRFGVVDRNGTLKDIAEAFQRGASDYIDGRLLRKGLTTARFGRVVEFATSGEAGSRQVQIPVPAEIYPSGSVWDDVEPGEEYTFQMLYVGLDHMKELRRKSSEDLLRTLRRTLQGILTRSFAGVGGRIWVWKEDDGVLLCPFDGERVTALIPAIRLVLNRVLMNIEQFSVTTPISWRMGLHVGNTRYEASGETSEIVSESLNFIFHLGERAVRSGQLAVTETALAFAPDQVSNWFLRGPEFESVPLYVLRDLA
ncbi:MAG: hypothetical protein KOO61_01810 [Spirochaetales bacterium]|nr:hypothetical protein [Spirochaetales bacterium]